MAPILTLIFVVALSMLITKAATLALVHTGMARERARFQARSAFSGAGFTTSESEVVVKHPVRRKVIMLLILLGNAGVVTVISSLILGFTGREGASFGTMRNVYLMIFGAALLFLAARSNWLDHYLERMINYFLDKYTDIRPKNFSRLMTVMEDYEVTEVAVRENEWLKGRRIADLKLTEEGLLVLGIIRDDDTYIGVPRGRYEIEPEDRLIVYGKGERVAALSKRSDPIAGKQSHRDSVQSHEAELQEQDAEIDDEGSGPV